MTINFNYKQSSNYFQCPDQSDQHNFKAWHEIRQQSWSIWSPLFQSHRWRNAYIWLDWAGLFYTQTWTHVWYDMKSWTLLSSLSCPRWNTNLTTWSPDYSDQLLLPLRQTHTQLWSIWTVELQTQTLTYSQTWSAWDGYLQSQTWSEAHPWTFWWFWFWTRTWIFV